MRDSILTLIIVTSSALAMAFALYSVIKPKEVKDEPAKPVCIEAHLGINKSESIVLCGTVVSYGEMR